MQLRLASASRDSAHLRNLLMLVSLYVVQNEDLFRTRRQCFHRCRYVHPVTVTRSYRRPLQRRVFSLRLFLDYPLSVSRFVLSIGQHDVDCNSVNPRGELGIAPELRQFFPCSHKYILRQLFPSHPASTHPGAQREHSIHVQPVQPLECLAVTFRREHYISRVIRRP